MHILCKFTDKPRENKNMVLLIIVALFLVLSITLLIVQPILSHNKHSPPGPTALPVIGHLHLLGPLLHHTFRDLAARHGPLFLIRLGSVTGVVVSSPEGAKEVLKTQETKFNTRPRNMAIKKLSYGTALAFSPYGPYWKFMRKLCMWELLGHRTIASFQPVRTGEYRLFLREVAKKSEAGEAVNLTDELMKLTNNVITQMMFGFRSSGTDGEAGEARAVVREVTQLFGEFNVSDCIWFFKNVDLQGIRKRIDETYNRYDALLEKIIRDREKKRQERKEKTKEVGDEEVKDFLDMLLDVAEDQFAEVQISRVHIKGLVLDFFTAGTDTTSVATEWALAELINNPNVFKKAREEIDRVVGKDRLVGESDGPDLPYIQAIIKETFRLHPPLPLVNRESVEECIIGDYVIPANTMVFINVWAIGRNPKYWESPLEFRPERFLTEPNGIIDVKGQHFQLLPFGSGRRGCPGISLALQEFTALIAGLIQCFDWKVAGPDGAKMEGDDVVVDMSERKGLASPRARDLICFPISRFSPLKILDP